MMKKIFYCFWLCLVFCFILSSCYAFLQADKLVYAGTLAKKPVLITTTDQGDSIKVETKE